MRKLFLSLILSLFVFVAYAEGISNYKELLAFAKAVNKEADISMWQNKKGEVYLTADIDMKKGKKFPTIKVYNGVFDGRGHKLYNWNAKSSLFGTLEVKAVVKNLTIDLIDSYHVGLFGDNAGLIMNVGIEGGSIKGQSFVGGLCGFNQGTISGCYNTAAVTGADMAIGGICGRTFGGTIKNCYNAGEISGNGYTRLLTVRRYVLLGVR